MNVTQLLESRQPYRVFENAVRAELHSRNRDYDPDCWFDCQLAADIVVANLSDKLTHDNFIRVLLAIALTAPEPSRLTNYGGDHEFLPVLRFAVAEYAAHAVYGSVAVMA